MADYTNYSFVSWSDTTPITSARLNQMSVNTEQVKIVNDDKPKGILKLKESSNNVVNGNAAIFSNTKIIALTVEGGEDNRLTTETTRYYRLTFVCPGIQQDDPGGEDGNYNLRFRFGNTANSGTIINQFYLSPSVGIYQDVSANAISNSYIIADEQTLRSEIIFGAGVYSTVFQGTGVANESFMVELERTQGSSVNNKTGWTVIGSPKMQFYIEDIGGFA